MKSYGQRLNRITQEFIMFAGFAALEGRFRALNNNDGTDDDVDSVSYGFATSGMAVCGARLLYAFEDLVHAAFNDGKNYFYQDQNNNQLVEQSDPFDQLNIDVQKARGVHQTVVGGNQTLRAENANLRRENDQHKKEIANLKQENVRLRASQLQQNSGSIQALRK